MTPNGGRARDPLPAYERAVETRRSYYEVLMVMGEVHLESSNAYAARIREGGMAAAPTDPLAFAKHLDYARSCLTRALDIHSGLAPARDARAHASRGVHRDRRRGRVADGPAAR